MPPVPPGPTSHGFLPPRFAGSGSSSRPLRRRPWSLTATGATRRAGRRPERLGTSATADRVQAVVTEDAIERDVIERAGRDSARAQRSAGPTPARRGSVPGPTAGRRRRRRPQQAAGRRRRAPKAAAAPRRPSQAKAAAAKQQKAQAAAAAARGPPNVGPADRRRLPLTSGFGMRWGRMHAGHDFAAPVGTPRHGDVDRHRDLRRLAGRLRQQGRDPVLGRHRLLVRPHEQHQPSRWARRSPRASSSAAPATPATRPARTCTSRSTRTAARPVDPAPWLRDHGTMQ